MSIFRLFSSGLALISLCLFSVEFLHAQAGCAGTLFVSDYLADEVRLFDACTGESQGNLSNDGRIDGPQAIRQGPDGLLYVVSEENASILRYDPESLQFVDIFVRDDPATSTNELNGLRRPTGLDFGPDGDLYIGGFQSNTVHRFAADTGQFVEIFVSNSGVLNGPDGGLMFGPDGILYVPNFDGDSISRFDADGQHLGDITAPGVIRQPRVLRVSPDGQSLLVSSYANGRIVSVPFDDLESAASLGSGFASLSGMAVFNGELLITGDRLPQIDRREIGTGESLGTLVERGAGGLDRPTFIYAYDQSVTTGQVTNEQRWMVGLGTVSEGVLRIESMKLTRGTAFGDAFDPDMVVRDDWGWFELEMTGCASGEIRYEARSPDFADFGAGAYSIVRIAPNSAQDNCEMGGFAAPIDAGWLTGSWFGGASRNGEGFFVDTLADGQVFLSWFTYGPGTP